MSPRKVLANYTVRYMEKPVLLLVDLDPHGIEIMSIARFGCKYLTHGGPALCVEWQRWIGRF